MRLVPGQFQKNRAGAPAYLSETAKFHARLESVVFVGFQVPENLWADPTVTAQDS